MNTQAPPETYEVSFKPRDDHGEYDAELNSYYFTLQSDESRLSSYVTRDEFNWLNEKLGLPNRIEVDPTPYCSDCGAKAKRFCKCPSRPRND